MIDERQVITSFLLLRPLDLQNLWRAYRILQTFLHFPLIFNLFSGSRYTSWISSGEKCFFCFSAFFASPGCTCNPCSCCATCRTRTTQSWRWCSFQQHFSYATRNSEVYIIQLIFHWSWLDYLYLCLYLEIDFILILYKLISYLLLFFSRTSPDLKDNRSPQAPSSTASSPGELLQFFLCFHTNAKQKFSIGWLSVCLAGSKL